MKTTIDIPEKELRDAMELTGARSKREGGGDRAHRIQPPSTSGTLAEKFGTFDGFMTQEELRRMREET